MARRKKGGKDKMGMGGKEDGNEGKEVMLPAFVGSPIKTSTYIKIQENIDIEGGVREEDGRC